MTIKSTFRNLWLWRQNLVWGWIESVIFTLLVLGFLYFMNPANPLFVKEGFPWPWIAPTILMFQYGFGPSILSAVMIAFYAAYLKNMGTIQIHDFQIYLVSGVAFILICGLFSASWVRRMLNAEAMSAYNNERLASLSSSYYMLRVSNDYLEQNIITKPATLRLALQEFQKKNLDQADPLSYDVAYSFLQILSQFCSIESLGIYLYKNDVLASKPFVEVGMMGKLVRKDPLVKLCMELDEICYVSMSKVEDMSECTYAITIPLITDHNKRLGMLIIKEISFWSLTDEILRVLNILVNYFIKQTVLTPKEMDIIKIWPGCTVDFVRQLTRLINIKNEMNIDSALIAVMVSKELRQHNVMYNLQTNARTLDSCWTLEVGEYDVLLTLAPFITAAGIHGYISRTTLYLTTALGLSFANDAIKMRSTQLMVKSPLAMMQYFIHFIGEESSAQ